MLGDQKKYFLKLFPFSRRNTPQFLEAEIEHIIGFKTKSIQIYRLAFTNSQLIADIGKNNERLELLGDSVLGLVVAHFLFKKYPYRGEDFLTEMRSKIVKRDMLNIIAKQMGIGVLLNKFSDWWNKQQNTNIFIEGVDANGDTLEALIGAIYLDMGMDFVRKWIEQRIIAEHINFDELEMVDTNLKNKLHSWIAQHKKEIIFNVDKMETINDKKIFTVSIRVDDDVIGVGQGFSKKEASQKASEEAVKKMNI